MSLSFKIDSRRGLVWARLPRRGGLAALGAAYLLTGRAYAALGRQGARDLVLLWPKKGRGLQRLAADFEAAYEGQLRHWALARAGLGARAETLRRALALSEKQTAQAGRRPGLSEEQQAEIARMLQEAEEAPKDPLGIAVPWDQRQRRSS